MLTFNSRDKAYKSNISAIATNQKVKLRIVVPRSIACSGATLAVRKDSEDTAYYDMFWAGMANDENEYWELHFYATTPGLYFYHFELTTPWGVNFVTNVGNGVGEINALGCDFQQTVYDENFKVPDFLKGGLIYQIFPDRFYKSNQPKKDVPKERVMRKWGEEPFWREEDMNGHWNNDYFGGDLKGVEEKLPYIKSLGATCIYLNPIFEAHSNHRYDTADYENIDSLLGSENDLKSLCKKAKENGIAIILDGVFSHTGCDSKYFNIYNRYKTVGAYNSKDSKYFEWYKFIQWPNEYQSWWGIKLLPEVIEENKNYRNYICGKDGILRKWLKCGISGWRLDVADELPDVFIDDLRAAVKEENKDAVIIGEVWEDATTKFSYGERRRYLLGEQLDSVMNYPFADAILNFVKFKNADAFYNEIMSVIENYPPEVTNILMNHIGTHDTERAITRLAGEDCEGKGRHWQYEHNTLDEKAYKNGVKMLKLASTLQYTLPGVPSLYYGDETGLQGMKDPFNRGCMNWGNEDKKLLKWYKRLGEIRSGCKAFVNGEINFVYAMDGVVVYERNAKDNTVLVAVNVTEDEKDLYIENWNNAYNIIGDVPADNMLKLKSQSSVILSK